MGPPAPVLALVPRIPRVSFVPAYVIGVAADKALRASRQPNGAISSGVTAVCWLIGGVARPGVRG